MTKQKRNNMFSILTKAVYNLWYYGFISEYERDSFRMRIDTARKEQKRQKKYKNEQL